MQFTVTMQPSSTKMERPTSILLVMATLVVLAHLSKAAWVCTGKGNECHRNTYCLVKYPYEKWCYYTGIGTQCCGPAPKEYISAKYG